MWSHMELHLGFHWLGWHQEMMIFEPSFIDPHPFDVRSSVLVVTGLSPSLNGNTVQIHQHNWMQKDSHKCGSWTLAEVLASNIEWDAACQLLQGFSERAGNSTG